MSVSIVFYGAADGADGPFTAATNGGWAAFSAWAATEPTLRRFVTTGQFRDTKVLSTALRTHLDTSSPPAPVQHTVEGILELIGVGDPEERIEAMT